MPLIEKVGFFVWNATPGGYRSLFTEKSPIIKFKDKFLEIPFQIADPNFTELERVRLKLLSVSVQPEN